MPEFDQALFLYLNSQDQEQPQTLNIFPSQPMHVVDDPAAPKGSMGTDNTESNAGAADPSTMPPPPSPPSRPAPAGPKDGKPAAVKREGSCSGAKGGATPSTSDRPEGPRTPDAKTLRRLAQNREAARKSRLRKKAYIQNLETSRIRLSQMEQELQRSRAQGGVIFGGGALPGGIEGLSPEAVWFDAEHARWLEEHATLMRHLRAAAEDHLAAPPAPADAQLRQLVAAAAAHHGVLVELKAAAARGDALHLVSGAWVSAAERCFLWIAGFRPSDLIKVAVRQAEPLTEAQAVGVGGLQRWAREAEAALDHELQAMHRSVAEAVSSDPAAALLGPYSGDIMATLSLAVGKLASLESFVTQADALRLQTLHRLPHILTAAQAARCFLAVADYSHRLRGLSELWLTRPRQEPATIPAAAAGFGYRSYLGSDSLL
ncbi:hypothetical protein ACP70R_042951 [Stipagrostis hirtigluma subsp. patula]